MTETQTPMAPDALVGLAFPVIRVRYAGPTDPRGSRYIATLRGVRHTEHYDYALDGSVNAYNAARAVWAKYRAGLPLQPGSDDEPRVFIPGDLDDSTYSFTVVPAGWFRPGPEADTYAAAVEAASSADADDDTERATVTRTDYPNAPLPGDRFGWVIAAANGGHMTEPYRDKAHARSLLATFAPDAHLVHVTLDWKEARS